MQRIREEEITNQEIGYLGEITIFLGDPKLERFLLAVEHSGKYVIYKMRMELEEGEDPNPFGSQYEVLDFHSLEGGEDAVIDYLETQNEIPAAVIREKKYPEKSLEWKLMFASLAYSMGYTVHTSTGLSRAAEMASGIH